MMGTVKIESAKRFSEVFKLLTLIRSLEDADPKNDTSEVKILRGLFFVHLYGALEYTVTNVAQRFLSCVNVLDVQVFHFVDGFCSIALNDNFSSLRDVGEDKKWPARMKLIGDKNSNIKNKISQDIFGLYLQNVNPEKLDLIFKCFGVVLPAIRNPSSVLHIKELPEHRNGIAHGRLSAEGVGRVNRVNDLMIRYNSVNETCIYIIETIEAHFIEKSFIKETHRNEYIHSEEVRSNP